MGDLIPEVQPFIQLFFIFHKKELGFRILNHILHLGPRIGGIYPYGHTPCALSCQVYDHPLGAVISNNGDTIPSLQAHGDKGRAHILDLIVQLVPGRIMP